MYFLSLKIFPQRSHFGSSSASLKIFNFLFADGSRRSASHVEFGKVQCLSSLPLKGGGGVVSDVGRQASSKIGRRTTSNWLYITLFAFVSWSVLSRAGSRRGSDCRPTLTAKRQRPGRRTSGASFCWPRPPSSRRWRRACPEGRMIYRGRGFAQWQP